MSVTIKSHKILITSPNLKAKSNPNVKKTQLS